MRRSTKAPSSQTTFLVVALVIFLFVNGHAIRTILEYVSDPDPPTPPTAPPPDYCHDAEAGYIDEAIRASFASSPPASEADQLTVLWETIPDYAPDGGMLIIGWDGSRTEAGAERLFAHEKYEKWIKIGADATMPLVNDMRVRTRGQDFVIVSCLLARGDAKMSVLAYMNCWVPWDEAEEQKKDSSFNGQDAVDPQQCTIEPTRSFEGPGLRKFTYPTRSLALARVLEAHEISAERLLVVMLNDDYGGHIMGGRNVLLADPAFCPLVIVWRDVMLDERDQREARAALAPRGYLFSRVGGTTIAHRFSSLLKDRRI